VPEKIENYEEHEFMDCAGKIAGIHKRCIKCKVLNSGLNIKIY